MTREKKIENIRLLEEEVIKLYSNYSHRDTCPVPGGSSYTVNTGSELELRTQDFTSQMVITADTYTAHSIKMMTLSHFHCAMIMILVDNNFKLLHCKIHHNTASIKYAWRIIRPFPNNLCLKWLLRR